MAQSLYNIQNWQQNTTYYVNDIIINNSLYYYCTVDHNSGLIFNTSFWGGNVNFNNTTKPQFIWTPSYNAEVPIRPSIKKVQFGDGYTSRSPENLNSILINLNLIFDVRTEVESRAILHFLHSRSGYQSFVFMAPPPYNINKLYVSETWSSTEVFQDQYTIKAEFIEVPV